MDDKSKRNLKLITGLLLTIPWVVYQLRPLFMVLRITLLEGVLAFVAVVGIVMITTIKKEKATLRPGRRIKTPRLI